MIESPASGGTEFRSLHKLNDKIELLVLGSLTWGSESSQQWEKLFGIIFLQFVGYPPGGNGI